MPTIKGLRWTNFHIDDQDLREKWKFHVQVHIRDVRQVQELCKLRFREREKILRKCWEGKFCAVNTNWHSRSGISGSRVEILRCVRRMSEHEEEDNAVRSLGIQT